MRAEARGLSGMLTASTPTDFRKREPSNSLPMSVPLGGTTSTIVTNSPRASFDPRSDRSAKGCVGRGRLPPGLSNSQGGFHHANVVGSSSTASAYDPRPSRYELPRIAGHVLRGTQIDVS